MKISLVVLVGLLALSTWVAAQTPGGWTIQMTPTQSEWLPGEPVTITVEMENTTDHLLPEGWLGEVYLDGQSMPCHDRNEGNPDFPPGVTLATQDSPAPPICPPGTRHTMTVCVTRQCNMLARAASTVGTHRLCYRQRRGFSPSLEVCCDFTVRAPQGEDKAALALLPDTLRDVASDETSVPPGLLEKYPASTYAGYALRILSISIGCNTYDCLNNPDEALHRECDRGGGEISARTCMERERGRMHAYAKAAGPFLGAHADFFDAPRIRRQYAYCLAFTGRIPDAWDQVRLLAQTKGKEAEEAKAYLDNHKAEKPKQ